MLQSLAITVHTTWFNIQIIYMLLMLPLCILYEHLTCTVLTD